LAIDIIGADRWGKIVAEAGRFVPAVNSFLAFIAAQHGLRFVTRYSKYLECFCLNIINSLNKQYHKFIHIPRNNSFTSLT
jgi:hypothetical protein